MNQVDIDTSLHGLEMRWSEALRDIPRWFRETAAILAHDRVMDIYQDDAIGPTETDRYNTALHEGFVILQEIANTTLWVFNEPYSRESAANIALNHGCSQLSLYAIKRLGEYGYVDIVLPEIWDFQDSYRVINRLNRQHPIRMIRAREEFKSPSVLTELRRENGTQIRYYPKAMWASEQERAIAMLDDGRGFIMYGTELDTITESALDIYSQNWTRIAVAPGTYPSEVPATDGH